MRNRNSKCRQDLVVNRIGTHIPVRRYAQVLKVGPLSCSKISRLIQRDVPVPDIAHLRDMLVKAVPPSHRDEVVDALRNPEDAQGAEEMIERDINYFIGVVVGQALRGDESWDFVSFGDSVPLPRQGRRLKHR
jgi:hypothetical protein